MYAEKITPLDFFAGLTMLHMLANGVYSEIEDEDSRNEMIASESYIMGTFMLDVKERYEARAAKQQK